MVEEDSIIRWNSGSSVERLGGSEVDQALTDVAGMLNLEVDHYLILLQDDPEELVSLTQEALFQE